MDLDGVKYIDVRKEDGELIANIPVNDEQNEVVCQNGYTVVLGYGEAEYVDKNDSMYAVENEEERELNE